ncbi:Ubiquitin system component Cue [Trinorchestia longiramus]|nr:Ubiquitin system component Cue [Trinorchestia longiramus]
MASTGAIPRTRKVLAVPPVKSSPPRLPHDVQILVGQDASEPLDVKLLTISSNGVQTKVPALSKSWCEERELMHYSTPPQDGLEVPGAVDAWLEQMEFLRQDLQWMLALPHHKFWSELIYARKVHNCLVSYLSQAPRWYDESYLRIMSDPQHRDMIGPVLLSIHKLVFLAHLRMATFKETKTCHISPSAFGDLLYDNYVIDMCQILDLCCLYHPSDSGLLSKAISNVFSHQPKYNHDLLQLLQSVTLALDNVEEQLAVRDGSTPMSLKHTISTHSVQELHAVLLYLLDTFYSLHNLLAVYPPAAEAFHSCEMHVRMSLCYERVVPCLSHNFSHSRPGSPSEDDVADLEYSSDVSLLRLQQLRSTVLATFRSVVDSVCLQPLRDTTNGQNVNACFEKYHHIVSTCLAEKTFMADYQSMYGFSKDINAFKDHKCDPTALQFLEDAVKGVLSEMDLIDETDKRSLTNGNHSDGTPSISKQETDDTSGMSQYVATGSSEVDAVQLAQLVSTVQELMPDLGAGFIAACLKHFRYSSEAVINALLEDSLPADLRSMDRSFATAPEPLQQPDASKSPVRSTAAGSGAAAGYHSTYEQGEDAAKLGVLNRANVYNDDEFDVFGSRRVDTTKVHRGKKKKDTLDADESLKERVRNLGHMYDERKGRSIYEDEDVEDAIYPTANYDDEYDDTYDDNEAGNMDATTEIAMPIRKRLNRPFQFGRGALNAPLQGDSNSDEDENGGVGTAALDPSKALPAEENEEEFERRRGLRKGLGGVQFIAELRESGGVIKNKPITRDRNLPASHESQNNRRRHGRFLPRDFHRDHHKPVRNDCNDKDSPEHDAEGVQEEAEQMPQELLEEIAPAGGDGGAGFVPFCEDPAVVRQRQAERKASQDAARNKRGNRGQRHQGHMPPPQPMPVNGFYGVGGDASAAGSASGASIATNGPSASSSEARGGARPKTYTNKSGKSWRQGADDEARGSRGGKWKEDTNHGKAQDINYRRKMEHKNKSRKQGAQNKFERNN